MDNFAGQWLHIRNVAMHQPSPETLFHFDDNLRKAFEKETQLFFESIMRENRSVLDLLDADYTFLNERLAQALRHRRCARRAVQKACRCRPEARAAGCSDRDRS